MAGVVETLPKRWTYEKYCRLDEDQRYEIIEGNLLMAPAPETLHQNWSRNLFRLLDGFVIHHKLGEIFYAPMDVILDAENVVQPDLIFVSSANLGLVQRRGIFGVPDLLVEIISPSTVRRDRYEKRELYARFGVKEYWIADPANSALEILVLKKGSYELHCCAAGKGTLTSSVFPGFEFDLPEIQ